LRASVGSAETILRDRSWVAFKGHFGALLTQALSTAWNTGLAMASKLWF
jgi:hypothetical protein